MGNLNTIGPRRKSTAHGALLPEQMGQEKGDPKSNRVRFPDQGSICPMDLLASLFDVVHVSRLRQSRGRSLARAADHFGAVTTQRLRSSAPLEAAGVKFTNREQPGCCW